MIIVGAIMVVFIPIMITIYLKTNEANSSLEILQAQLALSRLANLINSIGNLGEGSSITTSVYIPKNVKQIRFLSLGTGGEIVFRVAESNGAESDLVENIGYSPQYLVTGQTPNSPITNPDSGIMSFRINSNSNPVNPGNGIFVEIRRV